MRIVAWNCSMALHRKFRALLETRPDVAVVSECARPDRFLARAKLQRLEHDPIWIGRNPNKGLAVFTFNGYKARLATPFYRTLRYVAPIQISGPVRCNLLAVWAQNASAGGLRKSYAGPVQFALRRYRKFLTGRPALVAGDLNNNVIWDKPGWRMNYTTTLELLKGCGLVSAYHAIRGEPHGQETIPTIYWRDRKKDGPTYHIDYVFLPDGWVRKVRGLGTFEDWCGARLSDHVPIIVDIDV